MPRCPVCQSFQIVVVVSPSPDAWCDRCGARWIQQGCRQWAIHARTRFVPAPVTRFPGLDRFSRAPALLEPVLEGLRA